ncbi:MAG: SMODS domain-containing nucleotidyltransferase [Gammaproteobacteria bacterium]
MTVNSYLTKLADAAILRDREKYLIRRSVDTLTTRLKVYFGTDITEQFIFGSFRRGTILPRSMDANSDIDYMVVFKERGLRPQTYLDRLRRFVDSYYTRAEIQQAHPTIQLSLNHIRFELVPATSAFLIGYSIPSRASGYDDWQTTDPRSLNNDLTEANKANGSQIKRLVRLVKYWNALQGFPFESFELEKQVVAHGFLGLRVFGTANLENYFFQFMEALETGGWSAPKSRRVKIENLHKTLKAARQAKRSRNFDHAERIIKGLLPPTKSMLTA